MTKIERIESEVAKLSGEELADFRAWFDEFDAEAWNRQLASDIDAGKLDSLADQAIYDKLIQGQ